MQNIIGYGFFVNTTDANGIEKTVTEFNEVNSCDVKCYLGKEKIFICFTCHVTMDDHDFNKKEETLLFQVKSEEIKLINFLFYRIVDDYSDYIDDDVGWKSIMENRGKNSFIF